jgi:hypothetical protein
MISLLIKYKENQVIKIVTLFFTIILVYGCGKKAVEIDPEWAKEWVYAYDHSQTLTIEISGKARYNTSKGTHSGMARIKDNVLRIGNGKFLIMKTPAYQGPPLKRWEMEIDNMQFLHY